MVLQWHRGQDGCRYIDHSRRKIRRRRCVLRCAVPSRVHAREHLCAAIGGSGDHQVLPVGSHRQMLSQ